MFDRKIAVGVFAVCCIGLVLPPGDTFARSGAAGGVRSSAVGALPLVRPGQVPLVRPGPRTANAVVLNGFRALRAASARHPHRLLRRLPPVGGLYGPSIASDGYAGVGPLPQTADNVRPVPPGEPVVIDGRVCFAQIYVVPSEAGGTRRVTVSRC